MSRRWIVLVLIFVGILISYIDRGNLGIATPSIMHDFGFTPASMGVLLSAFFWTYAFFQIPSGIIVDRLGTRLVYAAAFLVWSLASSAIGLSQSMASILVLRMVLGMAESVGPIASTSYIRRNFAGAEAGLPIAIYIAGQNIGPATGTLLGTQLIVHFGWRAMFVITGIGALFWLPFWLWLAPRKDGARNEPSAPLDIRSLPWREVFATRAFWAMPLCIFLSSYFWYFLLTWVPTYLTSSRGYTIAGMGRVLSGALFAMAAVNITAGWLADRLVTRTGKVFPIRLWSCAAGYIGSGALLLLLVMPQQSAVLPIMLVAVTCTGIGNSNFWTISQHVAPANLVGRVIGFLNTVSQLAGAAAPLITGWILGPDKQFGVALAIAGISAPLAAACLIFVGPKGLDQMRNVLQPRSTAAV